jgi:DNA modification methylase
MLGRHKLICGDAGEAGAYAALLGDETVDLICTDPPYNLPIDGHVCGSGRIRHRNFAMGVGETNKEQFTRFLVDTLSLAAARCRGGAIAYNLHGLAPYGRAPGRRRTGLFRIEEPVCMEQDQRRHGEFLQIEARACFRVQGWDRTTCEYVWPRRD